MSNADRIAVRVKSQPLLKEASAIILGQREWLAVTNNPDPCNPPDLTWEGGIKLCGLPVVLHGDDSKLALVVDIP